MEKRWLYRISGAHAAPVLLSGLVIDSVGRLGQDGVQICRRASDAPSMRALRRLVLNWATAELAALLPAPAPAAPLAAPPAPAFAPAPALARMSAEVMDTRVKHEADTEMKVKEEDEKKVKKEDEKASE